MVGRRRQARRSPRHGRDRPRRHGRRGGPAGRAPDWPIWTARCWAPGRPRRRGPPADPVELPPGRYEVVLEPTAVVDLLTVHRLLRLQRQGGQRAAVLRGAGRGPVRPGRVHRGRSVRSDRQLGCAFDCGGHAEAAADLCRRAASASRWPTTGAARPRPVRRRPGTPCPAAAAFGAIADQPAPAARPGGRGDGAGRGRRTGGRLVGGGAGRARSSRGLLVTDNWYTRVLDPRTLVVTGLTRNGVWLIEDGQVTRPVQNLRFTQSYPQALAAGAVLGVGSALRRPAVGLGRHDAAARRRCGWRRGTTPATPRG